jgi:hypothetical protein
MEYYRKPKNFSKLCTAELMTSITVPGKWKNIIIYLKENCNHLNPFCLELRPAYSEVNNTKNFRLRANHNN